MSLALMTINVPVTVEVDAGSSSTQFIQSNVNSWDTFTFLFGATDAVTPLTIQGIDGFNVIGVDAPPAADAPEPGTLVLLAAGTAALLRKKKPTSHFK